MTELDRVVAMCEIRDCGRRADYFWAWGVRPHGTWLPLCSGCADDLAGKLAPEPFPVAPVAEMAGREYLASAAS